MKMHMKTTVRRSRRETKKTKKTKKTKTRRTTVKRGGTYTVVCSDCENNAELSTMFIPRKCSSKRGYGAHRICEKCWWGDKKTGKLGFADENASHKCPGCEKNLSFPVIPSKATKNQEVIEID